MTPFIVWFSSFPLLFSYFKNILKLIINYYYCLTSLIVLFWNFPLLFSHFKNILITYYLLIIIIMMIIKKSQNNYCSVGAMELCLLNLCSLIAFHIWLTRNHMFICEIWGKFTSFMFWNLSQVSLLNMWLLLLKQTSSLGLINC